MAERGSFWETMIGGTVEGPEEERKEKVLQFVIHRLKGEASLREVLREEDIVSVSVFEDQQSAEESNRKAADWVVQNLSELLRPTPEFVSGQVVVYEVS